MVKIGGLHRFSLLDYPGKMAAVVFTQGCPFRCPFCHNPSLVLPKDFSPPLSIEDFFSFLKKRREQLQGVVISGGEPTIQKNLKSFFEEIKALGYLVKLDTSVISPEVLKLLLSKKLIDYVAMDIKAPLQKYSQVTKVPHDNEAIKKSIQLLLNSKISFEFLSTILPSLHSKNDILEMAKTIEGAPLYVLQTFRPDQTLDHQFKEKLPFSKAEMLLLKKDIEQYVSKCSIR